MKLALSSLSNKNDNKNKTKRKIIKKRPRSQHLKQKAKLKNKLKNRKEIRQKIEFPSDSIYSETPTFIENWGGEAEIIKQDLKLDKVPQLQKNGCYDKSSNIQLYNTCAFDSVIFMISFGYLKYEEIEYMINSHKNIISDYIAKMSANATDFKILNNLRNLICKTHYENTLLSSGKLLINSGGTVTHVFENLLSNYGICSSVYTKKCLNSDCQHQISRKLPFISLNTNTLRIFGISALEESITIETITKNTLSDCSACKGKAEFWYNMNQIITFEMTGPDPNDSTIRGNLKSISKHLMVKDNIYQLLGVIEFVGEKNVDIMGHYKCHVLANNDVWFCYDDLGPNFKPSPDDEIEISIITYVIM